MASVISHQYNTAAMLRARYSRTPASWRKLAATMLLAAMLSGALGVAVYQRNALASLIDRASEMLGQSAAAAGGLPIAKSLVALLDQRSPGERTAAELANDKKRIAARPQQRALGKIRPALPAPFVEALTTPPVSALVPEVLPVAVPSLLAPIIGSPPAVLVGGLPGGGVGGPGGGVGPGGGGGPPGGGGGPPGTDVVPPVNVVAPIPEPATWLTMILGFYLLARAVRKQRPATVRGAALAA